MSAESVAERIPSGYQKTEVGVIPEDWGYIAIGNSIDLLTGFPFPSFGYSKSGVRLLRGSNVKRGITDWSEEGTEFWPSITSEIRRYVLKAGDIVIAMDGSLVGRSFAMLAESDVPAVLLQRVARIRSEFIEQNFLKAWICSQRFTEHCDSVKTVTAIPHISPADIKSFKIAIPPTLAEQEAIATALSDTDALIESLEQLIAKKRQIKQGAMQELLTGKRRLPGFEIKRDYKHTEIGVIPEDWDVFQLSFILKCAQLGGNYKNSERETNWPLIKMGNLGRGSINLEKLEFIDSFQTPSSRDRLRKDDVLFNTRNTLDLVGKVAIWRDELSEAYFNSNIMRMEFDEDLVSSNQFMNYILNTSQTLKSLRGIAIGTTSVAAIYSRDLAKIRIPLPIKAEQNAISTVLSDMDAEITTLEEKLAKTRQIKQGMMQELLTGRIRLV